MMKPMTFGSPLNAASATAALPRVPPGSEAAGTKGAIRLLIAHFLLMAIVLTAFWIAFLPRGEFGLPDVVAVRNAGFGCGVVALCAALGGRFRPQLCRYLAPAFALFGGGFMGGLTIAAEARFPGIAIQSVALTGLVFLTMLVLYTTGLVRLSDRMKMLLLSAVSAVGLIYLLSFGLMIFGYTLPVLHGSGTGAVLWFGLIAGLAAINLLADFERIDRLDGRSLAPIAEWHAVLALLTTFVWLYLSILRMLRAGRR